MNKYVGDRARAITELERIYCNSAINSCKRLYSAIYNTPLHPSLLNESKTKYKTENASCDSSIVLESVLMHCPQTIEKELRGVDKLPYHPVFIANPKGEFIFFNETAKILFSEFEMTRERKVQELYDDGLIFSSNDPTQQISAKTVLFNAIHLRSKKNIRQLALTPGNELVFLE